MAELVIATVSFVGVLAYGGVCVVVDWRRKRRDARWAAEIVRMKQRLPPHERCDCERCVEWRAKFAETLREAP